MNLYKNSKFADTLNKFLTITKNITFALLILLSSREFIIHNVPSCAFMLWLIYTAYVFGIFFKLKYIENFNLKNYEDKFINFFKKNKYWFIIFVAYLILPNLGFLIDNKLFYIHMSAIVLLFCVTSVFKMFITSKYIKNTN